jgi:hypothetical protein
MNIANGYYRTTLKKTHGIMPCIALLILSAPDLHQQKPFQTWKLPMTISNLAIMQKITVTTAT